MIQSIEDMIEDVLRREGGFVDHPADRGGPTKYGVTQATLSRHLGRPATRAEVRALHADLARDIYESDYYLRPRLHAAPARLRPFLFDCAVNHGPRRAVIFLQKVCNALSEVDMTLEEDGVFGPATRAAAEEAEAIMRARLLAALVEERRNFYRAIVAHDPSQRVFLKGWLARADEFDPAEGESAACSA